MIKSLKRSNLFKRSVVVLCALISISGVQSTAFAANPDVRISDEKYVIESIGQVTEAGITIQPTSLLGKSKTITKNYKSQSSIPASVYYEEYISGAWWGGTLKHKSTEYLSSSKLYQATFSGTMKKQ